AAGIDIGQRHLVEIGAERLGRPQYARDDDPFGLAGLKVGTRIRPERSIKIGRIVLVILPAMRMTTRSSMPGRFIRAVSCVAAPASITPRSSNSSQIDGIPPWP